ncbi:MAG: TonB-dependent receptor [Muribaculaceae bacterium]|nr:TonB-dependent receptor [Muribaculaceae bacterium]
MRTKAQDSIGQRTVHRGKLISLAFLLIAVLFPVWSAAAIRISGTVTDPDNEPLPGVTIMEVGTKNGTSTDVDGNFFIDVANKNATLHLSYIGFKDKEVKVGKSTILRIVMDPDLSELQEVVVVGYGTQQKASVVGSITTIEPEKLRVNSTRSMTGNLAGQLAGIIAYRPTGEPGYDSSSFWIRGISSFAGGTSPLVLIDGVERSLDDIDPAEIESFSILKDASASAMYGVRGANGVILVNTKRGKVGAPTVTFRVEQSFRKPTKLPEFIGAAEHMTLINNLAGRTIFPQQRIDRTASGYDPDLYPDIDWVDALTKDLSENTRANLSIAGGSDFLRYSLTGSYFRESGNMNRDENLPYDTSTGLQKYNVRANVDMDLTKTTLVRFNVGGYLQNLRKNSSSTTDVFNYAFETVPFVHPPIYSDGRIPVDSGRVNPWAMLTQTGYTRQTKSQIQSLVSVEQDLKMLTEGLKVRALFSFDVYNCKIHYADRTPVYYGIASGRDVEGNLIHTEPSNTGGSDFLNHHNGVEYGTTRTYFEAAATYNRLFNSLHRVDALLLFNRDSYDNGGIQPYHHQGLAGRASYTYDSRYVAEFNFGYNGSENFAPGHRYGFFPSGAIGWVISNESFMADLTPKINKLKLRASVGQVGNDDIGSSRRFAYITTINQSVDGYRFGPTNGYFRGDGIREGDVGVSNLTWETVTKYNLGIEAGLWNALDIQFDVFKEDRKDIFMQRRIIPTQVGFATTPYANFGKVKNHGLEAEINYHQNFGQDWTVGLRGTLTYAKNEVVEYDDPESVKGTYRSYTGQSIGSLYGYWADGLYTADDFDSEGKLLPGLPVSELSADIRPGDIKYKDMNGDGVINSRDQGYIGGVTTPRLIYGFGGNLRFKNVDFNFFFQGTGDSYRMISVGSNIIPGSGMGTMYNIFANYTDSWNDEVQSQDVFWPRLTYGKNTQNQVSSTWWKKNMSFLRLKTVELGYTLPKSFTRKYGSSNTRVYVSGNDLFYLSKFKLWDPELDTGTGLKYPTMRSIMVGLDFKF